MTKPRSLGNPKAREIREAYFRGESFDSVAKRFDVAYSTAWSIIRGETYKDAGGPIFPKGTERGRVEETQGEKTAAMRKFAGEQGMTMHWAGDKIIALSRLPSAWTGDKSLDKDLDDFSRGVRRGGTPPEPDYKGNRFITDAFFGKKEPLKTDAFFGKKEPTKEQKDEMTDLLARRYAPIHPDNLLTITLEIPESVIFSVSDGEIQRFAAERVLKALNKRYPRRAPDAWKRYVVSRANITPAMRLKEEDE